MNDSLKKRALITGATGYVGSNLVRHLLTLGWDVHIIIRPDSDLKILDSVISKITVHQHDATSTGMVEAVKKQIQRSCFIWHHYFLLSTRQKILKP